MLSEMNASSKEKGLLSVQVLREFYSVLRRAIFALPAEDVIETVRYLAAFLPVPFGEVRYFWYLAFWYGFAG